MLRTRWLGFEALVLSAVRVAIVGVAAAWVVGCSLMPQNSGNLRIDEVQRALLPMASVALDTGQLETAKRLYQRLLDVDPDSFDARMGLGDVAFKGRRSTDAARWYLAALANASAPSQRHEALLWHGRAALEDGQIEAARRSFQQLVDRRENAPAINVAWGHNGIGLTLLLDGDLGGAIDAMEQAVQRAPDEKMFADNLDRALGMLAELRVESSAPVAPLAPSSPAAVAEPAPRTAQQPIAIAEPVAVESVAIAEPVAVESVATAEPVAVEPAAIAEPVAVEPVVEPPAAVAAVQQAPPTTVVEALEEPPTPTLAEEPVAEERTQDVEEPAAVPIGEPVPPTEPATAVVDADELAEPDVDAIELEPALAATQPALPAPQPAPPAAQSGPAPRDVEQQSQPEDGVALGTDTPIVEEPATSAVAKLEPATPPPAPESGYLLRRDDRLFVQMGAFAVRSTAEMLATLLDDATDENIQVIENDQFYRVRIGPIASEETLDALVQDLEANGYRIERMSANAESAVEDDVPTPSGLTGFVIVEDNQRFLQLGAFEARATADSLAATLRNLTEETITVAEVQRDDMVVYRVRVGAVESDESLADLIAVLTAVGYEID